MSWGALLVPLGIYVALVVGLGWWVGRRAARTPEEYFLAGRGLGPLVLFMALFGTNATAFVLVGIPGRAYHDGVGVFSVNAPIIALGVPLTFWAIGAPARRLAAELGALTPAELLARRLGSPAVGRVLFALYVLYTVPYMVTAVKGAAVTLTAATEGAIPGWAGGLFVTAVALLYTTLGGMRATAWTNVLQGTLFMAFVLAAYFGIADSLGGARAATEAVRAKAPLLLEMGTEGLYSASGMASWSIAIALCVSGFPHMLVRLMAGRDDAALAQVTRLYPIALVLLWVPVVMIGVWGAAEFPGLEGRASDRIFSLMSSAHLPAWLAGGAFLAVLAAVMSTLDAQILTLSSMLVRDVLPPGPQDRDVTAGRWFGVAVAAAVYALSVLWGSSVFKIASLAFAGYVTLVPTLFFGVRWARFTAPAALASLLGGNLVLLFGTQGWLPTFGFLPVFWAFVAGVVLAVGVSLARPAPARAGAEP